MRPCWKPDSSPLRSDQGESRTPMPFKARRSKRRVSAGSTTWPCSPYGNRTHPSGLRGRCPSPIDERASILSASRAALAPGEPAQQVAGGLQPLGLANAQPTHFPLAPVGVEPTDDHQALSLAALPSLRTVLPHPCPLPKGEGKYRTSPMGFEPMTSTVTGWRALQAAPRGQSVA